MSIISHLKLGTKMTLLLGMSAVAMVVIAVIGAATLHQRMLYDRHDKLRAVVSSAVAIAAGTRSASRRTGTHATTSD